ncbi:MAG: hypothetical protein NTW28_38120, partial [Candidatus Solibacter sp.]|nr:hypothetical protein [Candidatus Solibacter sp.]
VNQAAKGLSKMKLVLALLCIIPGFQAATHAREAMSLLDRDDVWLLVMNVPEVMEAESRGGCLHVELTPEGKVLMSAMVRNDCPAKLPASGTIGLYTIDLRDGRIWRGVDPVTFIDSERLQRLRKVLISREQLRARIGAAK